MNIGARLLLVFLLTVLLLGGLGTFALMVYQDGMTEIQKLRDYSRGATDVAHSIRLHLERERIGRKNVLLRGSDTTS